MKSRSFTVVVYKEDDTYIAECPEIGTVDQGETIEQAVLGLKEATRLYLEEFPFSREQINLRSIYYLSNKIFNKLFFFLPSRSFWYFLPI
jgi:predicted RNase H-like HicB family nuclease